jgi:L-asparaginase
MMPADHPRLCVIYCGGTLAMVRSADGSARPPEKLDGFKALLETLGDGYELDLVPLMNRDSTNVVPGDWSRIAKTIHDASDQNFDGFVVVHGTDTMAYSAAAVAFALGPPPRVAPVVFTGAMRTPEMPDYDGLDNLTAACRVAASDIGEVCVAFNQKIFRGCRVDKTRGHDFDAFASPEPHGLGHIGRQVVLHDDAVRRGNTIDHPGWPPELEFADRVLSVAVTPGLEPSLYASALTESAGCRGILLRTLGAGNLPNREDYDWIKFIEAATRRDVPVLLLSPFTGGRTDDSGYAVGRAAIEAGAVPIGAITTSCAEVKFRHTIASARERGVRVCDFVRRVMPHHYFGEIGGTPQATSPDV